jgi:phenylacetate-CoA ligase
MHREPCPCGRTTPRLGPVIGRLGQMIKLKGTTIYPPAIMEVLNSFPEITQYIIEAENGTEGLDSIMVRYSAIHNTDSIDLQLRERFKARLRVTPELRMETPEVIMKLKFPHNSRKPVLFIDRRV